MVALLMLGIIPGTHIQISFANWLTGIELLLACSTVVVMHRSRKFTYAMIALTIYLTPLHAPSVQAK
jgi:hypothetical protein